MRHSTQYNCPSWGAICHTMIPIHQIRNRGQMHGKTSQWFRVLRPSQSPARSYKICELLIITASRRWDSHARHSIPSLVGYFLGSAQVFGLAANCPGILAAASNSALRRWSLWDLAPRMRTPQLEEGKKIRKEINHKINGRCRPTITYQLRLTWTSRWSHNAIHTSGNIGVISLSLFTRCCTN